MICVLFAIKKSGVRSFPLPLRSNAQPSNRPTENVPQFRMFRLAQPLPPRFDNKIKVREKAHPPVGEVDV
jgi:hypothetical protein